MNLKRYLLVRMITLGLLCWVVISAYVVWRTAGEVGQALSNDASRLHEMVEYSMYKRQINPEIEGSPVLVGSQYGLLLAPYCIRYEGWNGQVREEGCESQTGHPVEARLMKLLGVQVQSEPRPVGLWGQPFGELHITADPQLVLAKAVLNAADQLGLKQADLAAVLGVHRTAVSRLKQNPTLDPQSKQGELALLLIRVARALYSLAGGDPDWIKHFMHSPNKVTGGIPAQQVQSIQGLMQVLQFVDAMRGKL